MFAVSSISEQPIATPFEHRSFAEELTIEDAD